MYDGDTMTRKREEITFRSLGVVILADSHNPTVFNPDFAKSNRIIPKEWNITQSITTPGLAVMTCDNGVEMVVDPNRLSITQKHAGQPLQDPCDDRIHKIAQKYVRTLPHTPYKSLGLNCLASIERNKPLEWMTKKFLKPNTLIPKIQVTPRFVLEQEDSALQLVFNYANNSDKTGLVLIDCNIHYDDVLDSETLCKRIDKWPSNQKYIETIIGDLVWDDEC